MNELLASNTFNWVDALLLVALLVSMLVGLWRGFVFEMLSLAGWVAAFVAAQAWGLTVAAWLPIGARGSALNVGVGIAATFLGVLIVWGIGSRIVRMLVRATPLSGVDRVLGSVFGVMRAVLFGLFVATIVLMTPAARSADWQRSYTGPWLTKGLMSLKPLLPADVARHLPSSVT